MPIVVEFLQSATYQDQGDLQKIYRDAPDWLFAPFTDAVELIERSLSDGTLIIARFNDRILAAACVQRLDTAWEMSHLCVRGTTRRRGLAEQLVVSAQKMAHQAGSELRLLASAEPPEIQALAAKAQIALHIFSPAHVQDSDA